MSDPIGSMALGFITFHVATHLWNDAKGPRIAASLMGFLGVTEMLYGALLAVFR